MKKYKYLLLLPAILVIFQFSACEQQDIWEKNDDPIDDISPDLTSAQPLSNTEIEVQFSEEMDEESSEDITNYSIPGLTITGAVLDDIDKSVVILTTGSQQDVSYNLTVTGIYDEFLNEVNDTLNTATFTGDALPYFNAYPTNITTVRVVFSESVTGADVIGVYTIPGLTVSAVNPVSATVYDLTTIIQSNISYTLTVNSVWDTDNLPDQNDISDTDTFIGDILPEIASVNVIAGNMIEVTFTEDVSNADDPANYTETTVGLGITNVNPVSAIVYQLTTANQTDDQNYSLNVTNVEDINNNIIDPGNASPFIGYPNPYLINVQVLSDTSIDVFFSENVEGSTSQTNTNYIITDGVNFYTVDTASRDGTDFSLVHLTLDAGTPLVSGTYTITVSNVLDLDDTLVVGSPNEWNFTYP